MRDLMKRLDRLESIAPTGREPITIIRFIVPPSSPGQPPEPVSALCLRYGEEIQREAGETAKAFESRASAYFNRGRPAIAG